MTTPSSLLLAALCVLAASPSAAQTNGKPPIKGPGCGVPPVGVPLAQGAVVSAVAAAPRNLEQVEQTPEEFAAATALQPYGSEDLSVADPGDEQFKIKLTGKRDYWRGVAQILRKASAEAQEDKARAEDPELVRHSTTLSRQARIAEELVADAEADLELLKGAKAKKPETARAVLDRKAALFKRLKDQKF